MDVLRWGILGTGRIARGVAPRIQRSDGCSVVCFASRHRERANSAARESGLIAESATGACTYDELIRRDDVDAVYLTAVNSLHAPWCIRLLEAGKNVLCEKPLCAREGDARAIVAAAERASRLCVEGFMHLHHPQTARLCEIALDPTGPIGALRSIRSFRDLRMTDEHILSTRMSNALEGGALMDVGCYPISIARHISGQEPGDDLEASAEIGDPLPGETAGVDIETRFRWTFPSGVTFEGGCSFVRDREVFVELIGDNGSARTEFPFSPDDPGATPLMINGEKEIWSDRGDKFALQFEHFAGAVRGEHSPLPSPEWSIGQARTIERIRTQVGLRFDGDTDPSRRRAAEAGSS